MISAILFDLDETLLDRTTSLRSFLAEQYERFSRRLGDAPFEVWRTRFLTLDARGLTHKSVVYSELLREFGGDPLVGDILLADYRDRCCEHARSFPLMTETLRALRATGFKLGIVTNGETVFQARHIEVLGLRALVDVTLISEAEGLRKPDKAMFTHAAKRLNARPEECLFVGDNPAVDILGADAAGMQTAWFSNGSTWPAELPPLPGFAITGLEEIIARTEP
jgi:putative hydrolase of the HAD superfamily